MVEDVSAGSKCCSITKNRLNMKKFILFFAAAMYEVKTIEYTDYDHTGVTDAILLVDELLNTLADENGNVFVEK